MKDYNLAAIHDRIDEEHFEVRMHDQAIKALQDRVNLLEAAVREFREVIFHERIDDENDVERQLGRRLKSTELPQKNENRRFLR